MTDRLSFLTRRPVAHRGYHDAAARRLENTLPAVEAAIARGFAVEVDLQPTADGAVAVFHDDTLDRLTTATGPVSAKTMADLRRLSFRDSDARIPSLEDLLDLANGQTTLVIEIKGYFNRQHGPFVSRIVDTMRQYKGPCALMSFDPWIVATLKDQMPEMPRGLISYDYNHPDDKAILPLSTRWQLQHLLHGLAARPDFIAYGIKNLPSLAPATARNIFGLPLLTWTVRTAQDRAAAAAYADQIIFEGFDPDA